MKIVRDYIYIKPVRGSAEDEVAYSINAFNERTLDDLQTAIGNLKKKIGPKLKGYIIDLRNNPGGLSSQAVAVSDVFLDSGAIVVTRGRNLNETKRANAHPGDLTDGARVAVLINGGSAAAAEIVAGALQDNKRAVLIGTGRSATRRFRPSFRWVPVKACV